MSTGEGFLIIYAINDRGSFNTAKDILDRLYQVKGARDIPIVLVGNKSDLDDRREIEASTAEKLLKSVNGRNITFMETSAKTSHNVEEAFLTVARFILASRTKAAVLPKKRKRKWCSLI